MQAPHEELPISQLSLQDWVDRASTLVYNADTDAAVQFIIAGRDHIDGVEHRVYLNAAQGLPSLERDEYQVIRDYDSVIGISRTLPFQDSIAVYPLAPFQDSLKPNQKTHTKVPVEQRRVSVNTTSSTLQQILTHPCR